MTSRQTVPRDPFLHPRQFTQCLVYALPSRGPQHGPVTARLTSVFLNSITVDQISRQYRSHQAASNKGLKPMVVLPGYFTTDTFAARNAPAPLLQETANLEEFAGSSAVDSKEAIESLAMIWTGKVGPSIMAEREREGEEDSVMKWSEERDARSSDDDFPSHINRSFHALNALRQKGQDWCVSSSLLSI